MKLKKVRPTNILVTKTALFGLVLNKDVMYRVKAGVVAMMEFIRNKPDTNFFWFLFSR